MNARPLIQFILFFIIIEFLLLLITPTKGFAQEDIFDCPNSKKFATYLYNTNQYALAKHELERIQYFCDFDSTSQLMLLKSYRKLKDYHEAEAFFIQQNTSALRLDFRDEYIRLLMSQGKFDDVVQSIHSGFVFSQTFEHRMGALMMQLKWDEAVNVASNTIPVSNFKSQALINIANEGASVPHKNPVLAALISTILPGSGKMYSGYWGDGVISLAFCASTGLLAYRVYSKNGTNNAFTYIAGGMALSYYAANIYGGANAAKRFNENVNHELLHKTEHVLFSDY